MRPTDKNEVGFKEDHEHYRTCVGMLLYVVKNTRPDIANTVRDLTTLNDGPTGKPTKEMKHVIKYVIDTGNKGLKMTPQKKGNIMNIVAYSNSEFSGKKEYRISVYGFIIILNDTPISWRSKEQHSVTLRSSEAEYVVLSEAAKEVKLIWMLLKSTRLEVKLPITVRVDNMGAIFMSEKVTTSNRTKHADTRYRFVNEFAEDGFIENIFVKTKDNVEDIFTKNTSDEIGNHHHNKMIKYIKTKQKGC